MVQFLAFVILANRTGSIGCDFMHGTATEQTRDLRRAQRLLPAQSKQVDFNRRVSSIYPHVHWIAQLPDRVTFI